MKTCSHCPAADWEHELYEGSGFEDENGCPPPDVINCPIGDPECRCSDA